MTTDISDFLEEFDELATQLAYSRNEDFARLLRQWFAAMHEAPPAISDRVTWLMTLFPFERVQAEVMREQQGMGNDHLDWPEDRELRLSAQLNVFRYLADEKMEAWNFAHQYFYSRSNNIDDILNEMTSHLFDGHKTELRRYLQRKIDEPVPGATVAVVPGADRLVPINHNSAPYYALVAAMDDLVSSVASSNSVEPEMKEALIAELSAGQRLLKATTARLGAVRGVLKDGLLFVAGVFATTAIEPLAQQCLALLRAVFPDLPL